MALILKVAQDLYVGEERYVLNGIEGPTKFKLEHVNADTSGENDIFTITDERATEIEPDVFVSAGDKHPLSMASVVIATPKEILILQSV